MRVSWGLLLLSKHSCFRGRNSSKACNGLNAAETLSVYTADGTLDMPCSIAWKIPEEFASFFSQHSEDGCSIIFFHTGFFDRTATADMGVATAVSLLSVRASFEKSSYFSKRCCAPVIRHWKKLTFDPFIRVCRKSAAT